jgi:TRAP-type transport system periplasmic protein
MKMRSLIAALGLLAASVGVASAQETFTLKVGSILDPQHPLVIGARRMAEVAEAESKGRLKINVFPSSQLGAQREIWQNVQAGVIDGVLDASANLANFVPQFSVLDLPYLVRDEASAFKLLDSKVVQDELLAKGNAAGFHLVNFWEVTFRNIYTRSRPINAVADLKGQKIRVIPNPSFIALFRGLGAAPTPMAFGEIYTALQQGVIDGAENDNVTYLSTKHYEVAPNLAITNHMMLANTFTMSERTWQKLPEDLRKIMQAASLEGRKAVAEERAKRDAKAVEELKSRGIKVTEPDLAPFVEAGRKTYDEMAQRIGKDLVAKIVEAVK